MSRNNIIIEFATKLLSPLIILFAFYVQINGGDEPGGGFQAGAVMSAAIVILHLLKGNDITFKLVNYRFLFNLAVLGIAMYMFPGIFGLVRNMGFLNYNALDVILTDAQHYGIVIVEWGVGFTVFSSLTLIYFRVATRGETNIDVY